MINSILMTVAALTLLGTAAAVILYIVAQRFKVKEDPRIDAVTEVLPAANCGGCGYPGCRNFAEACVGAKDLEELYCPVGGSACMKKVASILGREHVERTPMIAVVRCQGSPEHRGKTSRYDSAASCSIEALCYSGDTGCMYGCYGLGDCVQACRFDAMDMDPQTGLPVVSEEKCTACGACVKICPRGIIQLRIKGPKSRRVFVSCINKDRGPVAKRSCQVACIGCGLCVKNCPFDAITVKNYLAYIDEHKCKLCRKCVPVCPTKAIVEVHFPPRKSPPEPANAGSSGQKS